MNKFWEKTRKSIDSFILAAGRTAYSSNGGRFPKSMFTKTVDIKTINSSVKIIEETEDSVTIAKTDENGNIADTDFRILSTTDMHMGNNPKLRQKQFQMLMNHIRATRPDLVVFTGDVVLSKRQHIDAIQLAQFMEKIGIYWTYVFGNHEAREEKGDFKYLIMSCMADFPHCLMKQGKPKLFGYGNYCVNILKSKDKILKSLFMFDSGRDIIDEYRTEYNLSFDVKGYDFIKNNQMDWYKSKLLELIRRYGDVKSFMYMHIPLKEYEEIIYDDGNGNFPFTGKGKVLYGSAYESVGCSPFNSGMFSLIKELGSTQAVFCGHDHVNDFCAVYEGIYLVYNQYNGYETYTMYEKKGWSEDKWMQGVTITDILPNGQFDISPRYNRMYL